jgi:hypothetical protein
LEALRACGVPAWSEAEAEFAWHRVAGCRDPQAATERTVPISSPSLLAIEPGPRSEPA